MTIDLQNEQIDFEGSKLPTAPKIIEGEIVDLIYNRIQPGDARYGFVPFYNFIVKSHQQQVVGHLNFKIGMTTHIQYCAGHIGYGIDIPFRGHSYAFHACRTLIPFMKTIYNSVIITTDPDNFASIKTIEKLGAIFLDLHPVPKEDPSYEKGNKEKYRYEWKP